jgi:mannose-6-phosphate isomerase-like protein (cupin superfamily)
MNRESYGGNLLSHIDSDTFGRCDFATGQYVYYSYYIKESEEVIIKYPSYTLIAIFESSKSELRFLELDQKIEPGDVIQSENQTVTLKAFSGPVRLLVAGTLAPVFSEKKIIYTKADDVYKVTKPWGYELWLNKQHPGYAFKKIFIKQSTKTSLQYHRQKKETNVIFSGRALLHYKRSDEINNNDVRPEDIDSVLIESISAIDVSPSVLHRLEAVTDILLYETSTPHLDDVIRVEDVSNRTNGRIASEHQL